MPSPACQTCQSRRIKCDGAKPICQKCAKSRRVCIEQSAVKSARFSIHPENRYASGETKRPRGPRPRPSLTLFRPTLDLPSRAVGYYLNYYIYATADLPACSACLSECLTSWKVSKRECNMVDLALSTLALAIFSRTQKHPPAAKEASLRYGRLLRAAQGQITQVTIRRCDEKGFDQFLLAIILMAWYETTMYCPANLNPNWPSSLHSWSHHDGAMAILKAWNDKQKENAPSSIIRQSRRGLLRSAIFRNCSLPDWIQNGNRFGEHGLDLAFDGIFIRVVNLRHAVKNLERKERPEAAEAEALKNKARELDDECREWALQIPSEWSFDSNSIPSSWPRRDFYSSIIYTCARKSYASVWLHYFALRMLINSTLLKLLQLSHPPQLQADDSLCQEERCECMTKLTAIADSFASTISFSLGRFKANAANAPDSRPTLTLNTDEEIPPALALPTVWPLSVASSLDDIKQSQQLWFRAQLARIGRVIGDGVLELLEPTNELTTD